MALVRGPIAAATAPASMVAVASSQSTSTGRAPSLSTGSTLAMKVLAGTITSSPCRDPEGLERKVERRRARCRRRRSGGVPQYSANSSSKSATSSPRM